MSVDSWDGHATDNEGGESVHRSRAYLHIPWHLKSPLAALGRTVYTRVKGREMRG